MMTRNIVIDKQVIEPGSSSIVSLAVGKLPSDTPITIQAHVLRAQAEGPTALILAGVHGDEINGIEIARRILQSPYINRITSGTLIVIPLLNIYGFINFNRYVPDGKDVNRSFPGTLKGSLASRIARTLTKYILPNVDYIFDLHTGGDQRFNYPQVRYTRKDRAARALALMFKAPFIIESGLISKSLRRTAKELKIPTLVFEGGESVRLNGFAIEQGVKGIMSCLEHLKIIDEAPPTPPNERTIIIKKTSWVRASFSGIFIWTKPSGNEVTKGEKLGTISDPYGQNSKAVISHRSGYIIGHNNASVVNVGDALFHIGYESKVLS